MPANETVCGIEVAPLTIAKLAILQSIGSPFMRGGTVTAGHVLQFVCLLSPHAGKVGTLRRWLFVRSSRRIIASDPQRAVEDAARYVEESFADAPGGKSKPLRAYYSLCAAMVGFIAREYHWSEREILEAPIKRLWQYRAEIMTSKGEAVLFNPSDKVVQQWLDRKN